MIALSTSMLSAVVGMAGGIVLLSVLLLYFDPLVAIPLHGVIQLVSNGSRTWVQRRHVRWSLVWPYAIPLLPLGYLGIMFATRLPPGATRLMIGVFVLLATWRGPARTTVVGGGPPARRFLILGAVVGFINVVIGATGPLIAPFFLNLGLTRQALVGTKAACQALGHTAKIALFGAAGFAFLPHASLLVSLCSCGILGTWLGSKLLDRVNEVWFKRAFKTVLTLVALRLILLEL